MWITGFAHYSELHYPGMRDLTTSPSTTLAAKAAGIEEAPIEVAEIQSAFTHEESLLVEALGLGADVAVNPSGGPLAANPIMATGLVRIAEAAAARSATAASTARSRHSTSGPCLQQNLVCILEGERSERTSRARSSASARPSTRRRRWDVSLGGLVREAALRALDDAEMDWSDIDAVVVGKAPDLFEGVMKPELYLSDALGAAGKPMFRVHTAGSVGGTTGIVACAPRRDRAPQAGARGRRTRSSRRATRSSRSARAAACSLGAGGAFAPYMRSLHAPHRRAARHRADGRGEGPARTR